MIFHLARAGVTVIEQPTDISSVNEWPHLKGNNEQVELVLDEGVAVLQDYEEHKDNIDGVNIKMEKSGGILEAVKIARQARDDKNKVMLGCMVGSSVGIAQSIYMSSLADYHDLDGPQLLEDDIASGIKYERESIRVDREIIGGPKLKRDVIEKYIQE
jgi:L-alanine-DL-glutamate epimerase-like enolase superfamily enzyme